MVLFLCVIMKQLSYGEKLKNPKWQKKRLEILKRDKFACKLCGDTKTQLHIHHIEYDNSCEPWECKNDILVTLCEDCHSEIESMKIWAKGTEFKDIRIAKIAGDGVGYAMFIQAKEIKLLNVYDNNKTRFCFQAISDEGIKGLQKFLKFEYRG